MKITRRNLLKGAITSSGVASLGAMGAATWLTGGFEQLASADDLTDYKALVCVYLNGGNDSNNTLIPVDAAFGDYTRARGSLALSQSSLTGLGGTSAGHQFALHPGLSPLAKIYQNKNLAWIANVGSLIQPTTASQVLSKQAVTPPFLFAHDDQMNIQEGWDGLNPAVTGWAGRGVETLPNSLRHPLQLISFDSRNTLLKGQTTPITQARTGGTRMFGNADFLNPNDITIATLKSIASLNSYNDWDNIRQTNLRNSLKDSTNIAYAMENIPNPSGNFGTDMFSLSLMQTAKMILAGKTSGLKRQVFLITWGSFDTHASQLGQDLSNQDGQLAVVGSAIDAFNQSLIGYGVNDQVITFSMSEFSRTLQSVGGNGSDHAWGGHHFVMGGPIQGGQVYGTFPSLTLGGPDDMDPNKEGRFVPTTSIDQVGATLMSWMGVTSNQLNQVFPNLKNFSSPTIKFV
jgi:uncharacterized protein (DUF1501 family)